jgi:hypothetical protein
MAAFGPVTSPRVVGRRFLATATIVAAVLGLTNDPHWFAASGAFGVAWWAWDAIWENVLGPIGGWFTGMLTGTYGVEEPPDLTVDDTIRLLEGHLSAAAVPRHVQIQSALRLAEIYRLTRQDPERARDVIARVRARWPDAPELQRFEPPADGAPHEGAL